MATTGFVSSSEVTDLVNDEMPEVYRLLVACGPPSYYSATQSFTTSAGTTAYSLPADFFVETGVYSLDTTNFKRPILPVEGWALSRVQAPQAAYSISMEYVPSPPVLASDGDVFDGVAGWDSLLTCRVARRLLQKRKADSSSVDAEIAALTQELRSQANRSNGPHYIRDVDDVYAPNWAVPYLVTISHYRTRAGNIEFYQPLVMP